MENLPLKSIDAKYKNKLEVVGTNTFYFKKRDDSEIPEEVIAQDYFDSK